MSTSPVVLSLPYFLVSLLALAVAYYGWSRRETPGAVAFAVIYLVIAFWQILYGIELVTTSEFITVSARNLIVLMAAITSVGWLAFTLDFTKRKRLTRQHVLLLLALPLGVQLLAWTNSWHELFLAESVVKPDGPHEFEYGPAFWGQYLYTMFLQFGGTMILLGHAFRVRGIHRYQTIAILVSWLIPTIAIVVLLFLPFEPISPYFNLTPIALGVNGLLFAWVLFRFQLLDVAPVARDEAMDKMSDAVVMLDPNSQVVDLNSAAKELFDVTDDIIGEQVDELVEKYPDTAAAFRGVFETTTQITIEEDERTRHFDLQISPVGFPDDRRPGRVVVLRDVTEKQRQRETLERQQQELQRQNERLDKFASVVSHDLRNPLGIAEMYLDFARESGDEDDFEAVETALERMDEMIEDLLTMARTETAVETREETNLHDVITRAWETTQTGGLTLDSRLPEDATLEAKPDLLQHVFENLFRNAADHNAPPVTVTVGLLENGSGFYVEDDGDGIPAEHRDEVFDHGYTTDEEGTGFGLSIVTDLVGAHGWSISVTEGSVAPTQGEQTERGGARFEISTGDNQKPATE